MEELINNPTFKQYADRFEYKTGKSVFQKVDIAGVEFEQVHPEFISGLVAILQQSEGWRERYELDMTEIKKRLAA